MDHQTVALEFLQVFPGGFATDGKIFPEFLQGEAGPGIAP